MLKGVDIHNPNLTRNPRIWWRFVCWHISFLMMFHRPISPQFIRRWLISYYGDRPSQFMFDFWKRQNPEWQPTKNQHPYPAWVGDHVFGYQVVLWDKVQRWFRNQAGCSSRYQFTSQELGLLYGGDGRDIIG